MKVIVNIKFKNGVRNPESQSVENTLANLGYQGVLSVDMGKQIIIHLDEEDSDRAKQKVAKMCETLLVNTVIEDYELEYEI